MKTSTSVAPSAVPVSPRPSPVAVWQQLLTYLFDRHYGLTLNDTPFHYESVIEEHIDAGISLKDAVNFVAERYITHDDNQLLYQLSHRVEEYGDSEWIHFSGTGYLLRLSAWQYPVLRLKRLGLSKACRRLVVTLIRRYSVSIIHLDVCGELLPGFEAFDW